MPPYVPASVRALDLLYTPAVLAAGYAVLWVLAKIFRVRRPGLPELGAILLTFGMSAYDPPAVLWALVPFVVGFLSGRSTKVLVDPTDILSPRARLSYDEYAHRAEEYEMMLRSPAAQQFLTSPYAHPTAKLTLLIEAQGLGMYRHARGLSLLMAWVYFTLWDLTSPFASRSRYLLLGLAALPFGHVMGLLWKYIRGHGPAPRAPIGGRTFKPTLRSFLLTLPYSLAPAIVAGVIAYLRHGEDRLVVTIAAVIGGLVSLFFLYQGIVVHLQKISLLEEGVAIWGVFRPYGLRWADIVKATIRERHNRFSGTDKLLVLHAGQGHQIAYPISVLSKRDADEVSREVRTRVPTSSAFHRPEL